MATFHVFKLLSIAIILIAEVFVSGCNKVSHARHVNPASVPRKTVPDLFEGDFTWAQVRQTGDNGRYGDPYSELCVGTTAHINKNGTGTWVFRYDITDAEGLRKSVRIDSEVSYEITELAKNRATIVVHFLQGKNYLDNKFQHALDESNLYPNGDFVYENIEYGRNSAGKIYFNAGPEVTFIKKEFRH